MNEHPAFAHPDWFRRRAVRLGAILILCVGLSGLLHAQLTDEQKKQRDAFLKAREEMRTVATPTPAASPGAKPKPATKKSKKGASPTPKASPARDTEADDEEEEVAVDDGKKKRGATPSPTTTPATKKRAEADEDEPPRAAATPRMTATPFELPAQRAVPTTTPPPLPAPTEAIGQLPADITIEKSGLEEEQGFEPPPPPPPRRGFFARLFGGGRRENYRYLNRSVIEAIRRAPVQRNRWKFIIVHNSGTRQGNARAFDYYHRRVKRMKNGMAYHFVVGNGTSSGNGEIEIGDRWKRQINGGHVHSDYLNNIGLGICLTGDFNRDRPTKAQMEATEELVKYLRQRCGKAEVRPHREMNPPRWATDCPGDAFPYAWFRRF
ncbi:MAG: hypothetical protein AVDCRST_MAG42-875 [uncultured Chthoniobacterales bacterium]|uniref:N-acetylmuramoyl-L-alanine amidase domain-containing protein n=1 Tax=uncultured Chthoniobacterales bacterium TaxID=1836801 RepID=A0A6J4HLC3_9BACT|nr:MAG: hypothetical protein AVDCRST_MAG42-875 [uncultured Chthoniobacterales bacterium]